MTGFSPTPDQREAIENRGGALLVSAAAGSGKTRVLTERLMSYLTDEAGPKSIDSFLIITFSRAAAAELRGRISTELAERAAQAPDSGWLRRQNALVQRAHIGTIHSFCADLLREKCHLIGLSPDFAIADDERVRQLRDIALRKVMDAAYETPTADFLLLADTVGAGRDDKRLADLVLELDAKLQSHARPEAWARAQADQFAALPGEAGDTVWGRLLLDVARDDAVFWAGELETLGGQMALPGREKVLKAYGPSLSDTAEGLRAFAAACGRGWDAARACLPIPFPRFGALRNPEEPDFVDEVKSRREACKAACKKLDASFADPSAKLMDEMRRTAPAIRALLDLTTAFGRQFAAEKRRRSLVDYGDLEHMAAELLTDVAGNATDTAREVAQRFTEVMVDEYQDVSRVQDLIIRAVSQKGENLFLVGDVKQSIYRFRLADPSIFIDKYLHYAEAAVARPGEPRRVLLRQNFRSRREVLEGANAVFRNIMSAELGDLDYDDNAALVPGAGYAGTVPPPELHLVAIPGGEEDDGERPDKLAAEATYVAEQIRCLVQSGATVEENGFVRPMGYGDVAILLRSANVAGGVYRRELTRAGIPVLSEQSGGFFRAPEVTVLLSLLAVVDNPHQDVPLISVLRSSLFGFGSDDLAAVRAASATGDFYTALCAAAETDARCRAFVDTIDRFRRRAPDMELGPFLREVYAELDCLAICCAQPQALSKRRNLMLLFELACRFEQSGYKGLRRFLLYLRGMDQRGEEPAAGTAPEHGAVRIMSIHKSKGLEFPVVFLCDTARRFNKSDARASVLVHPALGLGPKFTDAERGIEYPTLARRAIALQLERETLSEEVRLMYVALTRAKERLFITCALPDPEKALASVGMGLGSPIAPQRLLSMAAPCQWLMAAAQADGQAHLRLCMPAADGEVSRNDAPEAGSDAGATAEGATDALDLDWAYPHAAAASLPSKLSATELKSLMEDDPEAGKLLPGFARSFRSPELANAKHLSAADRGTATHLALRFIDFSKTESPERVRREIARMQMSGHLSEEEADVVDADAICRFFQSDIGRRILGADQVLREFPFTLLCRAGDFFPDGGDDELLLQGVVDCCIREAGRLTIIDYKTDRVTAEEVPGRAAYYESQVRAYARAMARICQSPVDGCILYFLRPGVAVPVECGDFF